MKYCQPHWDALRDAIERRGLSHLVAKSGEAAARRARAEIEGTATDRTFDPLMAAHNMVLAKVTEMGGLYLFTGEYCPVCEAMKGHAAHATPEETERHYTEGPADAVLQYCRENGLVLAA